MRERERRRRRTLDKNSVGDHGYGEVTGSAMVSPRVRMAAAVAAISGICGEETADDYVYCEMCGRSAKFVYFGQGNRRDWNWARVFRFSG